jgi:hypothetical protein
MTEITRAEVLWVSVDLAKNVFLVHVETDAGQLVWAKALRRDRLLAQSGGPETKWGLQRVSGVG